MTGTLTLIAAIGMMAGLAAFILGIAQLACEHAAAPHSLRFCIAALALLGAWTAFDCWDAWAGIEHRVDSKAVAYSAVLALFWGYRRAFGLKTDYRTGQHR